MVKLNPTGHGQVSLKVHTSKAEVCSSALVPCNIPIALILLGQCPCLPGRLHALSLSRRSSGHLGEPAQAARCLFLLVNLGRLHVPQISIKPPLSWDKDGRRPAEIVSPRAVTSPLKDRLSLQPLLSPFIARVAVFCLLCAPRRTPTPQRCNRPPPFALCDVHLLPP